MQPFRLEENTRFLKAFPNKIEGAPEFIRNQSITNIFAILEDISRSLAVIADLMINEDNRRRAKANKEQTEKLKQAMDSINKSREGKE